MNVLDLPAEVRPGQIVEAESFNKLLRALKSVQLMPGRGYTRHVNRAGTTLKIKEKPTRGGRAVYPSFAMRSIETVPPEEEGGDETYKVTLEPGRVKIANPEQAAGGGSGYEYFVPEIDGDPMDERNEDGDLPTLTVESGEMIFCEIERDESGVVIGAPRMIVGANDDDSDHYQPEDPADAGHVSQYDLIRILEVELDEADDLVVTVWRKSDIDLVPFLWMGDNVGGAAAVYKQHKETTGTYEFRSITGCWATDVGVDGDTIVVDWEGENVGSGESGFSAGILITRAEEDPGEDDCEQAAKFRGLAQGADGDERQIRISEDDEIVRIHGNGVNGSLTITDCEDPPNPIVLIEWEDGLITTSGQKSHAGGCPDTTPP
jgi:hypothetical protein